MTLAPHEFEKTVTEVVDETTGEVFQDTTIWINIAPTIIEGASLGVHVK